jgi:hypothetical protein
MTLVAAQSVGNLALVTPTSNSVTVSDTISGNDIIPTGGCLLRITTSGTVINVSVLDPNSTVQGNPGTVSALVMPSSGSRYLLVPVAAVNPSTNVATVTFSTTTGGTYEVIKF